MAEAMRIGPGETISDGWVTHLAAPFLDAGWTPADLRYAVDYRPDGDQHRSPLADIKKPAQWLRWRLSLWLDDPGAVLPSWDAERGRQLAPLRAWRKARPARSHSQQLADANAKQRARQKARRAADAAAAAAATPAPAGWFESARAALADARRRPYVPVIPAPEDR